MRIAPDMKFWGVTILTSIIRIVYIRMLHGSYQKIRTTQNMAATRTLMEIIEMEELKKTTKVTESIISSAKNLLSVPNDDCNLTRLVTNLATASRQMLRSVQKCKLLSSKKEKLWKLFHCFSVSEGLKMCQNCDDTLPSRHTQLSGSFSWRRSSLAI